MIDFVTDLLKNMMNGDGATLRNFKSVLYKSGYQVATHGMECTTVEQAILAIIEMNGNAGIWFSDGIFYIDYSFRVATKKDALAIGLAWDQISILRWKDMKCLQCTDGSVMEF